MSEITVFCNRAMIDLLSPIEVSKPVYGYIDPDPVYAAVYDFDCLDSMNDEIDRTGDAWWREMGLCNTTIDWHPRIIKREGAFRYLCDRYGISTEKNVAVALSDLAHNAGKTPIELMNWLAK